MALYKINWKGTVYGESVVNANSKEEAEEKAKRNEDMDFEWHRHYDPEWEFENLEEIPNE